jgi:hypothetical protein
MAALVFQPWLFSYFRSMAACFASVQGLDCRRLYSEETVPLVRQQAGVRKLSGERLDHIWLRYWTTATQVGVTTRACQ